MRFVNCMNKPSGSLPKAESELPDIHLGDIHLNARCVMIGGKEDF